MHETVLLDLRASATESPDSIEREAASTALSRALPFYFLRASNDAMLPTGPDGLSIPHKGVPSQLEVVLGEVGVVGGEEKLLVVPERAVVRQRLLFKNIERRAADGIRSQSGVKRLLVHDSAAAEGNEHSLRAKGERTQLADCADRPVGSHASSAVPRLATCKQR
eukprot:6202825-Pleurochrysis_carterae.AAC.5